ncbi:hypothetical protein [Lactococcus lactis]|uniref:DUF443 family protein n=1 Tax=Lactococcus lactis TaxID=1358 RepID=A0A552Z009_9LACT|nr:hypothetical protein [Lactococcus lactis]MCT0080665.1 hypothetical protein [Lactococcus lactis subsp. lactis]MCT0442632.1 hypothetical protein [Lactococcus lactis subsp. lactis]TRW72854.1 hypothetical protein FNJ53_09710 [Lactococcus lactis]
MVNKEWVRVKWQGLPSVRYFFLTLPNGQRVIVDHWSGFRPLLYIPFIRGTQKFDAYFIPENEDISEWENLLVSEIDMVWGAAKVAGGGFILKLLAGGVIGSIIIGLFMLLGSPLANMLKFLHIPPLIVIVICSFLLWWWANSIRTKTIKQIPFERFELKTKVIQIKFKDWLSSIAKLGYTSGVILFLLILGTNYDTPAVLILIPLVFLAFFVNGGILRTADVYINKKNYEEIKNAN